jgi:hypothetical protein
MTLDPSMKTSLYLRMFSLDVVCFQRYELLRAMIHRYVIGYVILVAAVISLLDLRGSMEPMPPWISFFVHSVSVLVATMVNLAVVTWKEWRHDGRSRLVVTASPILMLGSFAGVMCAEAISQLWLGYAGLGLGQIAVLWIFHYFLAEVFVGLVIFLLVPKVLSDLRGVPIRSIADSHRFVQDDVPPESVQPPQAAVLPDWAEIGGKRIAVSDLLHIEAEGNYIRVTTAQKRLYLPGPFGPVAEALPPELGLRVSRSDWVARAAVVALRREGPEVRLALTNGAEVAVPKNRRKAVLQWLEACPAVQAARSIGTKGNIDPDRAMM